MDAKKWKATIKKQMRAAGVYQNSFDSVIDTLASILDRRDVAYDEFMAEGGSTITPFTSDRGSVNMKKNPRLQAWQDLNTQALAYWKELGLTAAGLKRLNEAAIKEKGKSKLDEALRRIADNS